MNTWPSTLPLPNFDAGEDVYLPAYRPEFENGFVIPRKRFTRARRKFSLPFHNLSPAQIATLDAFFSANQGQTFLWTHPFADPSTGLCTTYTVMFSDDKLPWEHGQAGYRSVVVNIEEQ